MKSGLLHSIVCISTILVKRFDFGFSNCVNVTCSLRLTSTCDSGREVAVVGWCSGSVVQGFGGWDWPGCVGVNRVKSAINI